MLNVGCHHGSRARKQRWHRSLQRGFFVAFHAAQTRIAAHFRLCQFASPWGRFWVAPYGLQLAVFAWAWLTGWLAYASPRKIPLAALCLIVGCLAVAANPGPFWLTARHVYFWTYGSWIATVGLLFFPPRSDLPAKLSEAFKYLGDLSFPLYVIHYPVLTIAYTIVWLKHPALNYGWVHAVISIAAAALVLHYIERPFKAWLARGSERTVVLPDAYPVPAQG